MSYQVINPFIQFVDPINGKPLSGGSVYFGRQDTDPKNQPANRINVYAVQDNGTEVLLAQPITLNGAGQPQYSGSVKQLRVELYAAEKFYSLQLFNKNGAQKGYSSRASAPVDQLEEEFLVPTKTLAQAVASDVPVGTKYFILDRYYAPMIVVGAGASDGYYTIAMNNGNRLQIDIAQQSTVYAAWFGVTREAEDIYPAWAVMMTVVESLGDFQDNKPAIRLPYGLLRTKRPLPINGYIKISGEGKIKTVLAAVTGFTGDSVIINGNPNYHTRIELSDMTIDGNGISNECYYINLTGSGAVAANNSYRNITFRGASNRHVLGLLDFISNNFTECDFDGDGFPNCKALMFISGFCWNNNFDKCKFINLGNHSFESGDPNKVSFNNCWFEDGGVLGKNVINVSKAKSLRFTGCWFESCNANIVNESQSNNSIYFDDCEFVAGAAGATAVPFTFTTNGRINFGTNQWNSDFPCVADFDTRIFGANDKGFKPQGSVYYADNVNHQFAGTGKLAAPIIGSDQLVFNVTRTDAPSASVEQLTSATMRVTINCSYYLVGGFRRIVNKIYNVSVSAISDATIEYLILEEADLSSYANSNALTASGVTSGSISFYFNNGQITAGDVESSFMTASVELFGDSKNNNAYFKLSLR